MKNIFNILILLLITTSLFAQEKEILKINDFSAINDSGATWNLSDVKTNFLVVYFYPAAMTKGCTKQACAYRDDKNTFDNLGISVVAVSGDEAINLKYFKEAYQLNFPLLSDVDGTISTLFGVPTKNGGAITREIEGTEIVLHRSITTPRWTFVLNKDREIIYKNSAVNASEDSKKVKEVIQNYTQNK